MFTIEVKVHPFGNSDDPQEIISLAVANDGTGTHDVGNYDVWDMTHYATPREAARAINNHPIVRVAHWPRNNAESHLAGLVSEILTRYQESEWT